MIDKSFDLWWPKFQEEMSKIEIKEPGKSKKALNKTESMLEEILELSRINQRILNSPESLLPPQYFEMLNRQHRMYQSDNIFDHPMFRRMIRSYHELDDFCNHVLLKNSQYNTEELNPLVHLLENLGECIDYYERKITPRRPIRIRMNNIDDDNA